ncbi:MAG: ZIP family metal transporter [Candidatus Woesearchaeota archaeon]
MDTITFIYGLISVLFVSALSLIGVFLLFLKEAKMKKILLYIVSFAVGVFLGDIFIHLLPEAFEEYDTAITATYILFGIVFSFIVEKIIHWNHRYVHKKDDDHKHHPHAFAVMNLYGDAFHNFMDGIIIATSYVVSIPVGIATTIAVLLHELPQEIGDFGILLAGGFSKAKAIMFNLLISGTAILGTIVGFILIETEGMLAFLLPFSTGTLLYIVIANLIPQLHKSAHEENSLQISIFQVLVILLGIGAMVALTFLEAH